ncbi:MAG: hypothetical protein Q9217_001321 [Psora testacea]
MQISLQALVLAALALEAALAQPTHHHAHQHKRSLREVLNKRQGTPPGGEDNQAIYKDVNWSTVDYSQAFPTGGPNVKNKMEAEPTSTSSSEPSSKPSAGSGNGKSHGGDSGSCSNLADVYTSGDTSSHGVTAATAGKIKRATHEQDTYVGNTGGSKYGSNLKPEPNCEPSGIYSLKFTNHMGSDQDFWLWNKIGADGKTMNGMGTNAYYKFHLSNGQSAVFSVESNTQTAFSHACGRFASKGNVPNCNVGEANFNDQLTGGGSFYDVSMVPYNDIKGVQGNPTLVPMTISADGWDESTTSKCVYTQSSQNSPVQPGSSGKCAMGPGDARPFHVNVVYG